MLVSGSRTKTINCLKPLTLKRSSPKDRTHLQSFSSIVSWISAELVCVIMILTILNDAKPVYFPKPTIRWEQCMSWAALYGAIWALLGQYAAFGAMFTHILAFPLAFTLCKKIRCSFMYFHYVQTPFLNHGDPTAFDIRGARNLYVRHQSKVDNCSVNLGVWHVLPKSVYERNKEFIDSASKEEKDALFEEELKNTKLPVFLYCHGITKSRAFFHRVELYNVLQELDAHVIAFDYRGFADSTLVVPSKLGMVEDTLTMYSWIRELVGNEKPVFIWAHSIGTGIALKCFSKLRQYCSDFGLGPLPQPSGLVLESSFNNIYEVLDNFPFAKLFSWMPHYYKTMVRSIKHNPDVRILPEEYVKTLTTPPLLMLHAMDDDVVPYLLGSKLYGHISKSRKNEEERPIFKMFRTGGHMFICREKQLPGVVENFITKFK